MFTDVQRHTKCNGQPNMDLTAHWCPGSHSKQSGAQAHTASASIQFLRQSTFNYIEPEDLPSKSPDLIVIV